MEDINIQIRINKKVLIILAGILILIGSIYFINPFDKMEGTWGPWLYGETFYTYKIERYRNTNEYVITPTKYYHKFTDNIKETTKMYHVTGKSFVAIRKGNTLYRNNGKRTWYRLVEAKDILVCSGYPKMGRIGNSELKKMEITSRKNYIDNYNGVGWEAQRKARQDEWNNLTQEERDKKFLEDTKKLVEDIRKKQAQKK